MMSRMLCKKSPKIVRLLPEILANIQVPLFAAAWSPYENCRWAGLKRKWPSGGRSQYDKICTFVG